MFTTAGTTFSTTGKKPVSNETLFADTGPDVETQIGTALPPVRKTDRPVFSLTADPTAAPTINAAIRPAMTHQVPFRFASAINPSFHSGKAFPWTGEIPIHQN
jgi:hypothetical protein